MKLTSKNPDIFNAITCPLSGSNLLEAGAGTGKTFSLAFLYLRLLLEKDLRVNEILVTTFTNAATAELKGRIFRQIQLAERYFDALCENRDISEVPDDDELLIRLLTSLHANSKDNNLFRRRLRLALAQFDYAQIYTINGFALQLLRENADVLGCYSPEEILDNDNDYVKQAYLDLARENFTPLGEDAKGVGRTVANYTSDALFSLLTKMMEYREYIENTTEVIVKQTADVSILIDKAINSDHASAVRIIEEAIASSSKPLRGGSYSGEKLGKHAGEDLCNLKSVDAYADEKMVKFFSYSNLLECRNKKSREAGETFEHDFFDICEELMPLAALSGMLSKMDDYDSLMLLTNILRKRIDELKADDMALTHDDVVTRVADGAHRIHTTLKAALIDESQDTNSHQMKLFRQLFLSKSGNHSLLVEEMHATSQSAENDTIVFFVGDPKQAIYGFRGANLFSYFAIENEVDKVYIMDTNYRSTQSFTDSINAFFGGKNPFIEEKLKYHEIGFSVKNSKSGFGAKSLIFVEAEKDGDGAVFKLAEMAAKSIVAQLNSQVILDEKIIKPSDIAVLVRSGSQAKSVKLALSRCGLAASFTGKIGVYETDEAKLLLALLRAVHSGNVRLVKSLMLTPLFAYSLDDTKNNDIVTKLRADLHDYASMYAKKGFNVMFYHFMNHFSVTGRLLQASDGKRRLTNFIQLFELLQQVLQRQSISLAGLCDHLAKRIHDENKEDELRLEDDDSITIMTIHGAKGLEFPVVCLPFFDYYVNNNKSELLVSHKHQQAATAFMKPPHLVDYVNSEAEAEKRRLAYVALTRAKYCNIIVHQPAGKGGAAQKNGMLATLLETHGDDSSVVLKGDFVESSELSSSDEMQAEQAQTPLTFKPKTLDKPLYSAWQLESFSRLQQQANNYADFVFTPREVDTEGEEITSALMQYPAGARPGTALHEMYEHYLAYRQNDDAFRNAIDKSIDKHLFAENSEARPTTDSLADALAATAAVALAPRLFCLNEVLVSKQSIEMKFFMYLSPEARLKLLAAFKLLPDVPLPKYITDIIPTNGYMHGFIDYCFEHEGKFYVLDYKSNRLGETYEAFDRDSMHTEMQHHRYDLQALIYTLAVCKHLSVKTEFDYDSKIGGHYYLFVRGMRQGSDTGIYNDRVPWTQLEGLV